jgi:cytosine deaminase
MAALENAGRLRTQDYKGATMYTTLSPCDMCTGACILYKVKRVVIGFVGRVLKRVLKTDCCKSENKTFLGGEKYLQERGIEVVVLNNQECQTLMRDFITAHPEEW